MESTCNDMVWYNLKTKNYMVTKYYKTKYYKNKYYIMHSILHVDTPVQT